MNTQGLIATPQGLFLAGVALAKRAADGSVVVSESRIHTLLRVAYGKKVPPHSVCYITRAVELLSEVSDDELEYGIRHEAVIYDVNKVPPIIKLRTVLALSGVGNTTPAEVERLNKVAVLLDNDKPSRRTRILLKALLKVDDESDDQEDDDDSGDDGDEKNDSSDEGDSDFDAKHPRWPAGSPDGVGGEFAPKGSGGGAGNLTDPSNAPATITTTTITPLDYVTATTQADDSVDNQFRQTFEDMLNDPPAGQQGQANNNASANITAIPVDGVSLIDEQPQLESITTPYGIRIQSISPTALNALTQAQNGAALYRAIQLGESMAGESQYWSLDNPYIDPDYANKMGMPEGILPDYVLQGTLKPGAAVITNEAMGLGANMGRGIQVVTSPNGVNVTSFQALNPKILDPEVMIEEPIIIP